MNYRYIKRYKTSSEESKQALEADTKIGNNLLLLELDKLKQIYSYPLNRDFMIREIERPNGSRVILCYLNSIIHKEKLAKYVVDPILKSKDDFLGHIVGRVHFKYESSIDQFVKSINNGFCLLLIPDQHNAIVINLANFKSRGIEKAENETIIKGPKEAFSENFAANLSLIRKKIRSEHLIVEEVFINNTQREKVNLLYEKDIANPEILNNVRKRLSQINEDYVLDIELLEQLIEERPYSLLSSVLYTERPDKAAHYLREGHIVIMNETSPACLIVPITFWSLFHSGEDHYLRFAFGNFARTIRVIALFITLFTSAFYIAIINYHQEMIPIDLLLAIASSREKVPFPVFIEVIIMEFSFELIREAGLRIPSPLGPTIGIVGALILGQAAVQANIISPIIVIVVALSGLTSFTIADISLNYSVRILRFLFIFIAALIGIFGLGIFYVCFIVYLCSMKSFGVSFLAPTTPAYKSSKDTIFRRVLKREYYRPGYLLPRKLRKKDS